jgi:hypothetical protein
MTQEEIIQGNKLIAEFMGLKLIDVFNGDTREYFKAWDWPKGKSYVHSIQPMWVPCGEESRLPYHTSWDWLMPVAEKISKVEDMGSLTNTMNFLISKARMREANSITDLFMAIIHYITWYNNTQTQQHGTTI